MIREGETDRFPLPFSRGAYAVVISYENEFKQCCFQNDVELLNYVNELGRKKISYIIYGVWNGQWRTDLFILDLKILTDRIEKKKNQLSV